MNENMHIQIGPRSTVAELMEALSQIPGEYEVDLFGEAEFFIHVDDEDEEVTFTDKDQLRYETDALIGDEAEDDD